MWLNRSKNTEHMLLDIGSGTPEDGEFQPEGYVLNDIEAHPGIDLVCDIRELDKHVKRGQCRVIRASHVLEHFGTQEVDQVLKMLYGLIERDGMIHIFVPNFVWHAQLIFEGRDQDAVTYAFGGQKDEWDYHKTGFTPNILGKKLKKAGFQDITICIASSLEARARKR